MAVLKDSWLATRCIELFEQVDRERSEPLCASSFMAEDLLWCKRRAVLRHRRSGSLPARTSSWKWRAILHMAKDFQVLGEDIFFSDSKTSMGGLADMVLFRSGEKVLVRFWHGRGEKPSLLQVTDMVILMYLSGIWSGLIIRHEDGLAKVDFVNPDRNDAKRMIEGMHQRSRELTLLVASSTVPDGEPGSECDGCPYGEDCERKAKETR